MAKALLLRVDPETALNLPRPHAGQQRILAEAARFNVVAAGRRWGKNVLAEILVIRALLAGKRVAWFSPTYKMLLEDWRSFVGRLAPVTRAKSEQEHRIELTTSGVLDMWSLDEPDTTRGRGYHLVVVDEAAYVKDLFYAWGRVIQPMLSDYAGAAWFISTPAGFDGFYTLYEWGQDPEKPEWHSWQRSVTENPHLREDFATLELRVRSRLAGGRSCQVPSRRTGSILSRVRSGDPRVRAVRDSCGLAAVRGARLRLQS